MLILTVVYYTFGMIGTIGGVLGSSGKVIDGSIGIIGIVGFNGSITGIVVLVIVVLIDGIDGIVVLVVKIGLLTLTTTYGSITLPIFKLLEFGLLITYPLLIVVFGIVKLIPPNILFGSNNPPLLIIFPILVKLFT